MRGDEGCPRHFLVPLDGSSMAETALVPVRHLLARLAAGGAEVTVTLFHVLERSAPSTVHGERHLTLADEAQAYLEPLAADLRAAGLRVEVHVHEAREGDVARSIVEHADELGCDVVALSTHGSGGWRELWWGNIAQQVLRRGRQPVLLVPAHLAGGAGWSLRTVLAPLDGTAHHAEGLPAARCLASTFDAELRLLVVTPTAQTLTPEQARARRMLPGTMRAVLRLAEEGSHEYLAQVVGECERLGLRVVGEVRRGEPASAVLDATDRLGADLVVMASHGRCGLDAWLEGSVAPQVAGRLGCPLLLLRSE